MDTNPVNATFSGYTVFPVKRMTLLKDNKIDEREFDRLMELMEQNQNEGAKNSSASHANRDV